MAIFIWNIYKCEKCPKNSNISLLRQCNVYTYYKVSNFPSSDGNITEIRRNLKTKIRCNRLPGYRPAISWVNYTTSCKLSPVLLKMGEIIARYMSNWLELLINHYCCIYLVSYIIMSSVFSTCGQQSFITKKTPAYCVVARYFMN
jgi:hypothetical protein